VVVVADVSVVPGDEEVPGDDVVPVAAGEDSVSSASS
jgi:hypothetical protein